MNRLRPLRAPPLQASTAPLARQHPDWQRLRRLHMSLQSLRWRHPHSWRRLRLPTSLQSLLWRHPEWWSVAAALAAWTILAVRAFGGVGEEHLGDHGAPVQQLGAWLLETVDWLLTVLAMMVPLTIFSIRLTAARSLWRRRHRAIGGFLVGYLSPWLIVGAALAALAVALGLERWRHGLPGLAGIGFAVAALWHVAPARRRALLACHRTVPLAPQGWRADRDCVRFGWLTGGQCLLSCWALMGACVLAGHSLTAMVCASVIGIADRYVVRPGQTVTFSPLLGIALVYGLLGLSGV